MRKTFVIYDSKVGNPYPDCPSLALEAGEASKNMDTVLKIDGWLLENGADRSSLVIGVGGGTITDTVGFAASIYRRGISFGFIPTTLLGMVDAATGGKNGVNFGGLKNMVGTFSKPEFVEIRPEYLETLPRRDFLSGAAEMLKTFLISDGKEYDKAVEALVSGKIEKELIEKARLIKENICGEDFLESGERRKLNLGHSFGHSIEELAFKKSMDITHGEAVAMGIIIAARLAEAKGLAEKGLSDSLKADFEKIGLKTEAPFTMKEIASNIRFDKKTEGTAIHLVLPVRKGETIIFDIETKQLEYDMCSTAE